MDPEIVEMVRFLDPEIVEKVDKSYIKEDDLENQYNLSNKEGSKHNKKTN